MHNAGFRICLRVSESQAYDVYAKSLFGGLGNLCENLLFAWNTKFWISDMVLSFFEVEALCSSFALHRNVIFSLCEMIMAGKRMEYDC